MFGQLSGHCVSQSRLLSKGWDRGEWNPNWLSCSPFVFLSQACIPGRISQISHPITRLSGEHAGKCEKKWAISHASAAPRVIFFHPGLPLALGSYVKKSAEFSSLSFSVAFSSPHALPQWLVLVCHPSLGSLSYFRFQVIWLSWL